MLYCLGLRENGGKENEINEIRGQCLIFVLFCFPKDGGLYLTRRNSFMQFNFRRNFSPFTPSDLFV